MAIFGHSMALFRPSPRVALGEVDGEVRHVSVEAKTGKIRGVCQKDGNLLSRFFAWVEIMKLNMIFEKNLRNHAVKSLWWIYVEIHV